MAHAGVGSYKQWVSHTKQCVQDNHVIVLHLFYSKNPLVIVTMIGVVLLNVEEHTCCGVRKQRVNSTRQERVK
jgi:hypothetical protein